MNFGRESGRNGKMLASVCLLFVVCQTPGLSLKSKFLSWITIERQAGRQETEQGELSGSEEGMRSQSQCQRASMSNTFPVVYSFSKCSVPLILNMQVYAIFHNY